MQQFIGFSRMSDENTATQEKAAVLEAPTEVRPTKIKKLVMDGFKSFGRRTELLFEDGFNVVYVKL